MSVTKVLARDTLIEILTTAPSTYTQIKGINQIGLSPTTNRADTTDFDDDGNLAHMVASRGLQITLDGFRMEDESGGDRDPGQAAVETLAEAKGTASLGSFRVTSPGGEVWTFKASAEVTPLGGGNDDPNAWSATLETSGAITKA